MKNKILKDCIKLRSQVKIYVPSTVDVDTDTDTSAYVDRTLAFLSECFGGATCSEAMGAWVSGRGLVKEKVTLVFAFAHEKDLSDKIESIYEYCTTMKEELRQEAIALEVNGELYLI